MSRVGSKPIAIPSGVKIQIQEHGTSSHGCALVPLPDAISLGCYLMMTPQEKIAEMRGLDAPDD